MLMDSYFKISTVAMAYTRRRLLPVAIVTTLFVILIYLLLLRHDGKRKMELHATNLHLPDAMFIGIGKCGTMAVGFFLGLNSRVRISRDEVNFFCDDTKLEKGLVYYQQMLPQYEENTVTIERSPDYWKLGSVAAKRIKDVYEANNKTVKLLLVACDPTSRVLSWYVGGLYHYMEEGRPLEYPSLEKLVFYANREEVAPYYTGIRTSRYDLQLPPWLNNFDRRQLHIINGDAVRKNPLSEINKIERFLGLEPEVTEDHLYYNATKGFHCRIRKGRKECLDHTKGHKYPELNNNTVAKITDFFRGNNRNFTAISGVDFGWPK